MAAIKNAMINGINSGNAFTTITYKIATTTAKKSILIKNPFLRSVLLRSIFYPF